MAPLQAAEYRERYKTATPVNTIQISAAISLGIHLVRPARMLGGKLSNLPEERE